MDLKKFTSSGTSGMNNFKCSVILLPQKGCPNITSNKERIGEALLDGSSVGTEMTSTHVIAAQRISSLKLFRSFLSAFCKSSSFLSIGL